MTAPAPMTFKRLVRSHLRALRWHVAGAGICVIGSTLAALAAPWPLKLAFDHVLLPKDGITPLPGLQAHSLASLGWLCAALVAIAGVAGLFGFFQQVFTTRIGYGVVFKLRSVLFDHVQQLSLTFHSRARGGELLSKITTDTTTLRDVYSEYLLVIATHSLTMLGMLAVLLALDWRIGLVTSLTLPVLVLLLFKRLRRVKASARRQRSHEGQLAHRVGEMLQSVSLVKAFGREQAEHARFDDESRQSIEDGIRTTRAEAAATRLIEITTAAATALVLLAGGALAMVGQLTPGDLLVCMAYVTAMFRPIKNLSKLSARLARAQASIERIDEILASEPDVRDAPDAVDAPPLQGAIEFDNVCFEHEGRHVLDRVSLRIPAGQRLAIVGPSGAGKTTLARMLVRLLEPSSGRIRIDGVDISRWRRASLLAQVGMVLQDNPLLAASVHDNIAFGRPESTVQEVEAAARLAQAHDFITALPGGYGHVLGTGGATLSGGQRQRLGLARALVKSPAILVMDEPTSAVDAQSERQIRAAVSAAHQRRTSIIIAHQLESVADADWIVVMRGGRVVEQGTHAQLSSRQGAYTELFGPQVRSLADA